MPNTNKLNIAFSKLRGMPLATAESYSRNLRKGGVTPAVARGGGFNYVPPETAALMLFAHLRGSPGSAAENARLLGGLVVNTGGGHILEVQERVIEALGWRDDMTFAVAVGWIIRRLSMRQFHKFAESEASGIVLEIDRYRPTASLRWNPSKHVTDAFVSGWKEAVPDLPPPLTADGNLRHPIEMTFATPHLHRARKAYGVDPEANAAGWKKHRAEFDHAVGHDLHGTEYVTDRTLRVIANLYRYRGSDNDGHSLDPGHPWNLDLPDDKRKARLEEIENIIDQRYLQYGEDPRD